MCLLLGKLLGVHSPRCWVLHSPRCWVLEERRCSDRSLLGCC